MRDLSLAEVSLSALSPPGLLAAALVDAAREAEDGEPVPRRSQRARLPVLEAWRCERLIHKRPPGSEMPEIDAVELNLAPRPATAPIRELSLTSLQVPLPAMDGRIHEVIGLRGRALDSRTYALPYRSRGRALTVLLRPARGLLHVLEGKIRCFVGCVEVEASLCEGDTRVLRREDAEAFVELAEGSVQGARFRWVRIWKPPPITEAVAVSPSDALAGSAALPPLEAPAGLAEEAPPPQRQQGEEGALVQPLQEGEAAEAEEDAAELPPPAAVAEAAPADAEALREDVEVNGLPEAPQAAPPEAEEEAPAAGAEVEAPPAGAEGEAPAAEAEEGAPEGDPRAPAAESEAME